MSTERAMPFVHRGGREAICEVGPGRSSEGHPPSILAVSSELPWPLDSGGHLRTFHILAALARRSRVRLVAPMSTGQGAAVEAIQRSGIDVRPVPTGPRVAWREALRAATAAARREPYVFYRRHDRGAVRAALRDEARQEPPDVLYLDHLDSLVYRGVAPRSAAVIDLHNVYSILAWRAASEQLSPARRLYLRREASLLAAMERCAARAVAGLLVVSEEDGHYFRGCGAPAVSIVPNGVDCSAYRSLPMGRCGNPPILLYVGAMSWGPNISAADFLARDALPAVRARMPGTRLRIVGRDPAPEVMALGRLPGVEVTGGVPDIAPHLREASVLAVPLEAGGGTRLKILEAFAAGLPVVSTPVGCEGLEAVAGEHLLVADRAGFATAVLSLLADEALGRRFAARGRELARQRYDWSRVGEQAREAVAAAFLPQTRSPR